MTDTFEMSEISCSLIYYIHTYLFDYSY